MSAVSGGPPGAGRASGYDPTVDRGSSTQPVAATARTARIFNEELRKLGEMRQDAADKGEVVVHDRLSIEFERQGAILAARRGEAQFESREPLLTTGVESRADTPSEQVPPAAVSTSVGSASTPAAKAPAPPPATAQPAPPPTTTDPTQRAVPRIDTHA